MIKRPASKNALFPIALLFVCLLAYLPLCSFLFALKNDAFLYNFPNKFFFSEAIHAGYLPAWNPYLNHGFPLYADPGFAWWQPITWIFGGIGYNAYTFTLEVLLYIYIAGLGMYWLGRKLGFHFATAFAAGCMFMCSGFFIGNLQHINFLTCAAFIPWLTGTWLLYQEQPSTKNWVYCGVAAYLLCTGGHPAIPIAMLYFMGLLTIFHYVFGQQKTSLKLYILRQFKLFVFAVVLLLPLLLSIYRLWPHYVRAEPVTQAASLDVGFTLPSCISLLFPFATIKNGYWFGTDVSMRNAYFSLAGFVFCTFFLFQKNKKALPSVFFILALIMLVLSAGGFAKKTLYQHLPLLKFIRTNGEFRIFSIFSFIFCASYGIDCWIAKKQSVGDSIKKLFIFLSLLAGLTVLVSAFFINEHKAFTYNNLSIPARLKALIDQLSFAQTLFVASASVCILCLLYALGLQKMRVRYFIVVLLLDVIFNSWLFLPITGVSQTPVAHIQAIIDRSPEGFPPPALQYRPKQSPLSPREETWIGNWNWYGKQIVYARKIDYPSALKTTAAFFNAGDTAAIKNKPVLFLKSNNGSIIWKHFSPLKMEAATAMQAPDTLVLLQNYFHGWRAWVNKKERPVQLYQKTFIQVPVDENTKTVSFQFSPL